VTIRETSGPPISEWQVSIRIMAVGIMAGLFLGFIGPFGTYEALYTGWRLAYWVSLMVCGTLFFPVAYIVAREQFERRSISPWVYVPMVAAAGAVPMMVVVIGVTSAMFSEVMKFRLDNYLRVVGISLPMVVIHHLFTQWQKQRTLPTIATPPVPTTIAEPQIIRAKLVQRLPGRLGSDILCLQMEDHYVRVHTSLGQEMILMRMRDAIAEMEGIDGIQVHRSWWVARHAVTSAKRDGKSATLTLSTKAEVPVARDRVTDLKAAGWLS
jgi:LytTr DNA-binding domain